MNLNNSQRQNHGKRKVNQLTSLESLRMRICDSSSLIFSSFLSSKQQNSWSSKYPSISMQYIFSLIMIYCEQAVKVSLYSAGLVGLSDRFDDTRRFPKQGREASCWVFSNFSLSSAMLSLRGLLTFSLTNPTILLMALLSSALMRSICPSRLEEMASIFSQAPKILLVLRETFFSILRIDLSSSSVSVGVAVLPYVVFLSNACISSLILSSLLWMSQEQSCCLTSIYLVWMFPARQSSKSRRSLVRDSLNASMCLPPSPFPPFLYSSLLLSIEFSVILMRMPSCCPSFCAILPTLSLNSLTIISSPSSTGLLWATFCGQQCCGLTWMVGSFLPYSPPPLAPPCATPTSFFFLPCGDPWATNLLLLSCAAYKLPLIMPSSPRCQNYYTIQGEQ